jgi:hypothetical protein
MCSSLEEEGPAMSSMWSILMDKVDISIEQRSSPIRLSFSCLRSISARDFLPVWVLGKLKPISVYYPKSYNEAYNLL